MDRSAIGRHSRRKGKAGEREVVHLLRPVFPEARRSYHQSRRGSDAPDLVGVGPFWIEVAVRDQVDRYGKLKQAEEALAKARASAPALGWAIPVAVTRRTGAHTWEVTMRFGDLSRLVETQDGQQAVEVPNLDADLPVMVRLQDWLPLARAYMEVACPLAKSS